MNLPLRMEAPSAHASASRHAELVLRAIEAAAAVHRRHQFFIWMQSYLQVLLPHQVAVCAAYQRQGKVMEFETFHNVPLAPQLLGLLSDANAALMRELVTLWVSQPAGCVVLDLARVQERLPASQVALLEQADLMEFIAHGVARPQRPAELESLFVLASAGQRWTDTQRGDMDLLLPYLHSTYVRVQVNERTLGQAKPTAVVTPVPDAPGSPVTARECEVLRSMREGKTNAEIAVLLGISPLTVKNHVQRILRKLDASNRAQAVGLAIQRNLL